MRTDHSRPFRRVGHPWPASAHPATGRLRPIRGRNGLDRAPDGAHRVPPRWPGCRTGRRERRRARRPPASHPCLRRQRLAAEPRHRAASRGALRGRCEHRGRGSARHLRTRPAELVRPGARDRGAAGGGDGRLRIATAPRSAARRHHARRERGWPRRSGRAELRRIPGVRPDSPRRLCRPRGHRSSDGHEPDPRGRRIPLRPLVPEPRPCDRLRRGRPT